ncbi:hypothetical protein BDZ89DRAFT_1087607 [Hymenopellis radicata]|nr:hypothetical protein BDZ89DRAFT_1087607 [Hymenopellis radicata]
MSWVQKLGRKTLGFRLGTLPFSSLIPAFLHSDLPAFMPQTVNVGDVFRVNNSLLEYTIISAYSGTDNATYTPVNSFAFYNNPLSSSCDVSEVEIFYSDPKEWSVLEDATNITVTISCFAPQPYELAWSWQPVLHRFDDTDTLQGSSIPRHNFSINEFLRMDGFCNSEDDDLDDLPFRPSVRMFLYPICRGDTKHIIRPNFPKNVTGHLDCNSEPIEFMFWKEHILLTDYTKESGVCPRRPSDDFGSFEALRNNMLQTIYHSLRKDLGIKSPNQIWASAKVFNDTISDDRNAWWANHWYRANMGKGRAAFVRVPMISYLRYAYRRKPLGSAIASVFVASFTMLAALWKLFSLVAGILVAKDDELTRERDEIAAEVEARVLAALSLVPRRSSDSLLSSEGQSLQESLLCPPSSSDTLTERRRSNIDSKV